MEFVRTIAIGTTKLFMALIVFLIGLIVLLFLILLIWLLTEDFWTARHFKGQVPDKFGPLKTVYIKDKSLIREGCGVAIFKMKPRVINDIQQDSLYFFEEAIRPRNRTEQSYFYWRNWQETPTDIQQWKNLRGGNTLKTAFNCAQAHKHRKEVLFHLGKPGSYLASGPEQQYLVIPERGWIVIAYYG